MAWVSPSSRTTGTLITAAIWNQDVVDNVQYLYDSAVIPAVAQYDSGWFAVTYNTTYNKAHGLGAIPLFWIWLWASSATPTTIYAVRGATLSYAPHGMGADATNITVATYNDAAQGVMYDSLVTSATGYFRGLAWL